MWALDYHFDPISDGKVLKFLHVVDEHTREALAVRCERIIDADQTVITLGQLVSQRGRAPEHIRCDDGPELTANAIRDRCHFSGTGNVYIDQTHSGRTPHVESLGSHIRDELHSQELFTTVAEPEC